jgi:uncharacterized membrane protein
MVDGRNGEGDEERGNDPGNIDTGRVLALSDGVFAIAGTLLVLDLRLPNNLATAQLPGALGNLVPEFRAYGISYALIGLFWLRHHAQFRRMKRISRPVLLLNLVLLAMITLMPFSAQLLSQYGDVGLATALYAANMAVVLALQAAMGAITLRRGDATEDGRAEDMVIRPLVGGSLFLVSVGIGLFVSATAAEFTWLSLPVLGVIRRSVTPRILARRAHSDP